MQGMYHFECLNPACDWGTDVFAENEEDAARQAMSLHDQHWIAITQFEPHGPRFCPADHYTLMFPSGELHEY